MNLKPSELICFSLKKQLNEIMSNVTKQEYKIQLMEIHGKNAHSIEYVYFYPTVYTQYTQ